MTTRRGGCPTLTPTRRAAVRAHPRGAPDEPETEQDEAERLASAAEAVRRRMEQGQTQKDAVKAVSAETGVKKNALYRYVARSRRITEKPLPKQRFFCFLHLFFDVSGSRCGSNVRVRGTAHDVRTAQHRRPRSPAVCRLQGNPPASRRALL